DRRRVVEGDRAALGLAGPGDVHGVAAPTAEGDLQAARRDRRVVETGTADAESVARRVPGELDRGRVPRAPVEDRARRRGVGAQRQLLSPSNRLPSPPRIEPSPRPPRAPARMRPARRLIGSDCSHTLPGPRSLAKNRPSPPNSADLTPPTNWMS